MKKITYTIIELWDGFYVELNFDKKQKIMNAWLCHEDIGIKDYVVGLPAYQRCENKTYTIEELTELALCQIDKNIDMYIECYMND